MRLCKNIIFIIISAALTAFGIGLIIGRLSGGIIYFIGILSIALGIYLGFFKS